MESKEDFLERTLVLRLAAVVCFFIAAINVLESFFLLSSYWAYVAGKLEPAANQEWQKVFRDVAAEPSVFLGLNFYNILLWNGVIFSSIGVLRFQEWARKCLRGLLGFDMMVTVTHLVWSVYFHAQTMRQSGWFITLNALQVGAIIVLSHPKIIELTQNDSNRRSDSDSTINDTEMR